jgi:hypothetical protein
MGRQLALETVLDDREFDCPYDACSQTMAYKDLTAHAKRCLHKPHACPFDACSEKAETTAAIIEHIVVAHGAQTLDHPSATFDHELETGVEDGEDEAEPWCDVFGRNYVLNTSGGAAENLSFLLSVVRIEVKTTHNWAGSPAINLDASKNAFAFRLSSAAQYRQTSELDIEHDVGDRSHHVHGSSAQSARDCQAADRAIHCAKLSMPVRRR